MIYRARPTEFTKQIKALIHQLYGEGKSYRHVASVMTKRGYQMSYSTVRRVVKGIL